jgi:uncharacterized protein
MQWLAFKFQNVKRFVGVACLAIVLTACAGSNVVADKARRFDQATAAYDAQDYAAAYAIWSQLADENDLAAMRNAAHLLRRGLGVEKNPGRALDLYTEAARKGLVLAMANVAEMHINGEGTLKDPEEAARWYALAANGGLSIAMVRLAEMLEQGNGVPKDPARARELYDRAIKNGYVPAQEKASYVGAQRGQAPAPARQASALPVAARSAEPVSNRSRQSTPVIDEQDRRSAATPPKRGVTPVSDRPPVALEPFDPAALAGLPEQDAQKLQAGWVAYQAGQTRDALKLWRSLADKGIVEAQLKVGSMFENGAGVNRDMIEAYRWYKLAAARSAPAAARVAALTTQMSPAERAIAESMAAAPNDWPARQR